MRYILATLAIAFGLGAAIANARNCFVIGSQTYCDNGLFGQRVDNPAYWNDGTSSQQSGNLPYFDNGRVCQRIGDQVYCR
jgi:hypothetical protein